MESWTFTKSKQYNDSHQVFYEDANMEPGEVADDDENESPLGINTKEEKRMFPVQKSFLKRRSPNSPDRKGMSRDKYANLGWGDMVRVGRNERRRSPIRPFRQVSYDNVDEQVIQESVYPSLKTIAKMTPQELHDESIKLLLLQGPKLSQQSDNQLRKLVQTAIGVDGAYLKMLVSRSSLLQEMKAMREKEEKEAQFLLRDFDNTGDQELTESQKDTLCQISRLIEHRHRLNEMKNELQKKSEDREGEVAYDLPPSHIPHPYAIPIESAQFNPSIPPPTIIPSWDPPQMFCVPPPQLPQLPTNPLPPLSFTPPCKPGMVHLRLISDDCSFPDTSIPPPPSFPSLPPPPSFPSLDPPPFDAGIQAVVRVLSGCISKHSTIQSSIWSGSSINKPSHLVCVSSLSSSLPPSPSINSPHKFNSTPKRIQGSKVFRTFSTPQIKMESFSLNNSPLSSPKREIHSQM